MAGCLGVLKVIRIPFPRRAEGWPSTKRLQSVGPCARARSGGRATALPARLEIRASGQVRCAANSGHMTVLLPARKVNRGKVRVTRLRFTCKTPRIYAAGGGLTLIHISEP